MATKKESKKSTAKSKTKKANKKIKLTYQPILSAGQSFTALLRKKEFKDINGIRQAIYVPSIDGLPMKLEVQKGEVIEVTEEQYEQLVAERFVETPQEYQDRQDFIDRMATQHPESPSIDQVITDFYSTARESQTIVYNDKLLRVD